MPAARVNSSVPSTPITRFVISCAIPASGCASFVNGQLPNVKPVKMKPRIVQNSRLCTTAGDGSEMLHLASARIHQVTMDTITKATVATIGVARPNIGTRVVAGSGSDAVVVVAMPSS